MPNERAPVTPSEMIDAFVHPPRIVSIGRRTESAVGELLIVSHVELWPWRVVIRGLGADKRATTALSLPDMSPFEPEVSPGTLSGRLIEPSRATRERFRAQHVWVTTWVIEDDVSTEYRLVGASSGGHGGDTWWDFDIRFHPGAPAGARFLTLVPPGSEPISLDLDRPS